MNGLLSRTPLRVKLVAAVVLLAALGLVISGVAASAALRGYLLNRVDSQLQSTVSDRGAVNGVLRGGRPDGSDGGPGRADAFGTVYVTLVLADGTVVQRSTLPSSTAAPRLPAVAPTDNRPYTVSAVSGDTFWRVVNTNVSTTAGNGELFVAVPLDEVQRTLRRLQAIEVVVGLMVLALLALGGFLLVRRNLRPLVEVERTAELIAAGDLSLRVPEADPRTEVGSLAQSFNAMLTSVEGAFAAQAESEAEARASEDRMRRFVGDASHELRTPLTSIRGFAELYRSGALPTGPDVDRAMSRIEGEASRMGLLVEDLLLLARLDQQRPLERAPVDMLELAGDAVHDAQAVDPARSIELEVVPGGPAPHVLGDATRLRQVVSNLVANALTHTPAETPVQVRVRSTGGEAVVEVIDHGSGIAPEDRERVFERFYRADTSRTRASGGSGLGLSIVAALVAAHHGSVDVHETSGGGATFRVAVPLG